MAVTWETLDLEKVPVSDLLDIPGIAEMMGVKRETVDLWLHRESQRADNPNRKTPPMPPPVVTFANARLWSKRQILAWALLSGRTAAYLKHGVSAYLQEELNKEVDTLLEGGTGWHPGMND